MFGRVRVGVAVAAVALLATACWIEPAAGPPPVTPLPRAPAPAETSSSASPAVVVAAAPDTPFAAGQTWVGRYQCSQGITELTVAITGAQGNAVQGTFVFQHVPTGAAGQYVLTGTWEPSTRTVTVDPGPWIAQPPNYVSVGMRGEVSADATTWSGTITHPGCGGFWLRRDAP